MHLSLGTAYHFNDTQISTMRIKKNPALLLSCVSSQVRNGLKADVEQMKLKDPNFKPGLVVLQVPLLSWRM